MAHETPTVVAKRRERTGSRYAQRLRSAGQLPAVIYGHQTDPVSISVDSKEIITHLRHGAHVMNVEIEGAGTETCLVKDLQFGYLGDNVIHIDFTRVNLGERVTVHVHLAFVNEPEAAKQAGAIVRHDHSELTIECKVSDIPDEIRVDLSKMKGTVFTAGEVKLPEGVDLAEDKDTPICTISFVREEETEVGEEAAVEVEGAEPERIGEKKEEGEGEAAGEDKES